MSEIAAIVLAAGRSTRYRAAGGPEASKLVAALDGKALVRHVAEAALASRGRPVIVVTGFERERVEKALEGLALQFVHNGAFASGLASSLKVGIAAAPAHVAGALILLGDMPYVSAALLDRLGAAFARNPGTWAVAPTFAGMRGNPVLLARSLFAQIGELTGDEGARKLLAEASPGRVIECPVAGEEAAFDIDTPEGLETARRRLAEDRK